jgi:hypothetical protein
VIVFRRDRALTDMRPGDATMTDVAKKGLSGDVYPSCGCPYCHGPLLVAPGCSGRAASDGVKGELFYFDPLPSTNIAVGCRSCKLVFFPLRERAYAEAAK